MKKEYFGTDGVRGVANEKLSPELACALGIAAGRIVMEGGGTSRAVIGRDTRRSGSMLSSALAAGLCSAGIDVVDVGVAPTGAISYLARTQEFGLGCVISASHNPAPDNGIKLMASDGRKLSDETELSIESLVKTGFSNRPTGSGLGVVRQDRQILDRYFEFLSTLAPNGLQHLKLSVDCANGAAYELAPRILSALGADCTVIGNTPNGLNINEECGATRPDTIQEISKANRSDAGIAFDGDADRCVMSDSEGRLFNGDRLMAIWAAHQKSSGRLNPAVAVGTVMSNGGFSAYLAKQGILLERVDVGDKYVSQKLVEIGGKIGGEQSGHLILPEYGPTGDGLITAIEVLNVLQATGKTLAEFYDDYQSIPQVLINVSVMTRDGLKTNENLNEAVALATELVGEEGRVNVRPSGTQEMVRVMVESLSVETRDRAANLIVECLRSQFGGQIYSEVDLTYALGD